MDTNGLNHETHEIHERDLEPRMDTNGHELFEPRMGANGHEWFEPRMGANGLNHEWARMG